MQGCSMSRWGGCLGQKMNNGWETEQRTLVPQPQAGKPVPQTGACPPGRFWGDIHQDIGKLRSDQLADASKKAWGSCILCV